jgi:hypothetical protein
MEKMINANSVNNVRLFNSALETGIRALIILNAAHPKMFDLSRLIWFDHLVVHTGYIGGPESLHPDLPHRGGELLVRRTIIEQSLSLMRRLHLVNVVANDNGILYQASDEAYPFIELMRSPYTQNLKDRATWLAENICTMDDIGIRQLVSEKIGRWGVEFQNEDYSSRRLV